MNGWLMERYSATREVVDWHLREYGRMVVDTLSARAPDNVSSFTAMLAVILARGRLRRRGRLIVTWN
jgi:hypothetical protein